MTLNPIQQQIRIVRDGLILLGSDCRKAVRRDGTGEVRVVDGKVIQDGTGEVREIVHSVGNTKSAEQIIAAVTALDEESLYRLIPRIEDIARRLKEVR